MVVSALPLEKGRKDILLDLKDAQNFRLNHDLTEVPDIRMLAAEQKYVNSVLEWWQRVFWEDMTDLYGCKLGFRQLDLMGIEIGELVLAAAYRRLEAKKNRALKPKKP